MNNALEKSINDYFIGKNKTKIVHKDRFYPKHSSVYIDNNKYKKLQGQCLRAAYYSCIGCDTEDQLNINTSLSTLLGEYTENMLINIYKKQGILIDRSVKFSIDQYNIFGKIDCIILENDSEVGVEIKSLGSNKYNIDLVFGNKYRRPYPKWQNLFQTLIYCYAFRERLKYFYLQYIRRDTCERKTFCISIEPQRDGKIYPVIDGIIDYRFTINELLDRYKLLYSYILKEEVPPMEYIKIYDKEKLDTYLKIGFLTKKQIDMYNYEPFGDFQCKYCEYRKICDGEK